MPNVTTDEQRILISKNAGGVFAMAVGSALFFYACYLSAAAAGHFTPMVAAQSVAMLIAGLGGLAMGITMLGAVVDVGQVTTTLGLASEPSVLNSPKYQPTVLDILVRSGEYWHIVDSAGRWWANDDIAFTSEVECNDWDGQSRSFSVTGHIARKHSVALSQYVGHAKQVTVRLVLTSRSKALEGKQVLVPATLVLWRPLIGIPRFRLLVALLGRLIRRTKGTCYLF